MEQCVICHEEKEVEEFSPVEPNQLVIWECKGCLESYDNFAKKARNHFKNDLN